MGVPGLGQGFDLNQSDRRRLLPGSQGCATINDSTPGQAGRTQAV